MTTVIKCPRCDFVTEHSEPVVAAAILTAHSTEHSAPGSSSSATIKAPPVERPKIQASCPKADWQVFNLAGNPSRLPRI